MEIPSLRPELGYELLKVVMLRESYLQRLERAFTKQHGNVDMAIVGLFDVLRELTVQIIELVGDWEKAQVSYPVTQAFSWNGQNYLQKMLSDVDQFVKFPAIQIWFGFSIQQNPFIIPPNVLHDESVVIPEDAFLVFGQAPQVADAAAKAKKTGFTKSPYTTPIINDPEVFTHLSVKNKLNRKFKHKLTDTEDEAEDDHGLTFQQLTALKGDVKVPGYNPFLCYLSAEMLDKIRICYDKLLAVSAASGHPLPHRGAVPSLPVPMADVEESFTDALRSHSKANYLKVDQGIQTHRYMLTSSKEDSKATFWSPHEVYMMKQVQRKGGELFTITVTSTSGRVKTPFRKTRFERMHTEIGQIQQEIEFNSMVLEDILSYLMRLESDKPPAEDSSEAAAPLVRSRRPSTSEGRSRRPSLAEARSRRPSQAQVVSRTASVRMASSSSLPATDSTQMLTSVMQNRLLVLEHLRWRHHILADIYMSFSIVAEGNDLLDPNKQRERHLLAPGQTRLQDEKMSLLLEEKSIRRVQLFIRRKYGKALRKIELIRREKAASKIQAAYRIHSVNQLIVDFIQKNRLANMVYNLYCVKKAAMMRGELLRDKMVRDAVQLIQRCFRGYLGRKLLALKRKFVYSLKDAANIVNVNHLRPGDIEELADVIEDYINDYTMILPLEILTILRGVLYIFNNNASEFVIMSNSDGYTEKKYIYARTASWEAMKLIIRRKGRLLRRLRAFIKHSLPPNASRLYLSADSIVHLEAIVHNITEEDLQANVSRGKKCVIALYKYVCCVYEAYKLQHMFPQFFSRSLPSWYRSLIRIKEAFDDAEITRKIENRIQYRLEECKRYQAREGKKYKHISFAIHKNKTNLDHARTAYHRMKGKLKSYMMDLLNTENQQLATLEAIVRAKTLALDVAEGDYKEYMKIALIPSEAYLKELLYNIDNKQISLLTAQSDLIQKRALFEKYQTYRDFDKICKYKHIYEYANDLGKIKADLYIILEAYKTLIEEIGGMQYVPDLKDEALERYQIIKTKTTEYLKQRRDLEEIIHKECQNQYNRLFKMVLNNNVVYANANEPQHGHNNSAIMNNNGIEQNWDTISVIEKEYEENENKICCRRDYEKEFRKKRKMESFTITSPHVWTPCILFVDIKLPRAFIKYLTTIMGSYNFVMYPSYHIVDNMKLQDELQAMIDKKQNIIILMNRSLHPLYYIPFDSYISNIKNVLIPVPRCVFVSADNCFTAGSWFETSAFDQHAYVQMESNPTLNTESLRDLDITTLLSPAAAVAAVTGSEKGGAFTPLATPNPSNKPVNPFDRASLPKPTVKQSEVNDHVLNLYSSVKKINQATDEVDKSASYYNRYLYDMLVGKMRKIGRYFRFILVNHHITENANLYKQVEMQFVSTFHADFNDYLSNVKLISKLVKQDKGHHTSINEHVQNKRLWMDIIISMNLAILFHKHDLPFIKLTDKDVSKCMVAYRTYLANVDIHSLCDMLESMNTRFVYKRELNNIYETPPCIDKKLDFNQQFQHVWDEGIDKLDYYHNPVRVMLVDWIKSAREYLKLSLSHDHKFIPYDQTFTPLTMEVDLCIASPPPDPTKLSTAAAATVSNISKAQQNYGLIFLGELLHAFYHPLQVYENTCPIWKLSFDQLDKDSVSCQSLACKAFNAPPPIKLPTYEENEDGEPMQHQGEEQPVEDEVKPKDPVDSRVYVYHHGEEMLVELHIYAAGQELLPDDKAHKILQKFTHKNSVNIRIFGKISINDLIVLIQPNFTEIYEGKMMNNNLKYALYRESDFYQLMSNWITIDHFNNYLHLSVIRARYLILTKLTVINNYNVRLEIYEERFGELLILIFGLPSVDQINNIKLNQFNYSSITGYLYDSATQTTLYFCKINRSHIFKLMMDCDVSYEKDKLEAFDTIAMSYIFSDRLSIRPSVLWRSFLLFHDFLPITLKSNLAINVRYKLGPGRLVGRELINLTTLYLQYDEESLETIPNIYVLMTIFEMNSPQNAHELRVCLYHFYDGKTVEYRISAMERLLLFDDNKPVLKQLIEKMRLVYTDLNEPRDRILLDLPQLNTLKCHQVLKADAEEDDQDDFKKFPFLVNVQPFEVEGDEEYEISSQLSDASSDDESSENEESMMSGDSEKDEDKEDDTNKHSVNKYKQDSGWGWAVSFDRSPLYELRGNLIVSATLCLPKKGFNVYIFDPRTCYQIYRFISYFDSMAVLGKNMPMIEEDLSNLDESNVLDLLDEVLSNIEVQDTDSEGMIVVLLRDKDIPEVVKEVIEERPKDNDGDAGSLASKDSSTVVKPADRKETIADILALPDATDLIENEEAIVLARVKELPLSALTHPMCRKRTAANSYRVTIDILRAKDLTKVSTFGARNAVCILKHNMREVGRTHVVKGSTQPDWSLATKNGKQTYKFDMYVSKEAIFTNCTIDMELHDTDAKGALTDYLGHVRFMGDSLKEFLAADDNAVEGQGKVFELLRSKKRTDVENKHVRGTIEMLGSMREMGAGMTIANKDGKNNRRNSYMFTENHFASATEDAAEVDPLANAVNRASNDELAGGKIRVFYIYIVDLHLDHQDIFASMTHTSKDTNIVLVALVNGMEVNRISVPYQNQTTLTFNDACIEVSMPAHQPVSLGNVQIDIYLNKNKYMSKKINSVHLNGMILKDFVQKGLNHLRAVAKQTVAVTPLMTYQLYSLTNNLPNGKLTLASAVKKMADTHYTLRVHACRNLIKGDLFGKSDPFVRVYFNSLLVGETAVLRNTLDPIWPNETFTLSLPFYRSLANSAMLLKVYDYDDLSEEDLLGVRYISGLQLVLLCGDDHQQWADFKGEYDAQHRTIILPLLGEECMEDTTTFQPTGKSFGDIELSVIAQQNAPADIHDSNVKLLEEEFSHVAHPLERTMLSLPKKRYLLYILSAKDLANADTFGKSDPFVRIFFNGEFFTQTRTIYDLLSPVFNEHYTITLPYLVSLEMCHLQLDVFDEDNNTLGDFLGTLNLAGEELTDLVVHSNLVFERQAQAAFSNPQSILNSGKSYDLQKSMHIPKKANKWVKGSIQILLTEEEDSSIYEQVSYENSANTVQQIMRREVMEEDPFHRTKLIALKVKLGECQVIHLDGSSPPNKAVKKEDVYLTFWFNGQCICTIKGTMHLTKQTINWAEFGQHLKKIVMPNETDLELCFLDIQIYNQDHQIIAATFLTGKLLKEALDRAAITVGASKGTTASSVVRTRSSVFGQAQRWVLNKVLDLEIVLQQFPHLVMQSKANPSLRVLLNLQLVPVYKQLEIDTARSHGKRDPVLHISSHCEENDINWKCRFDDWEDEDEEAEQQADDDDEEPEEVIEAPKTKLLVATLINNSRGAKGVKAGETKAVPETAPEGETTMGELVPESLLSKRRFQLEPTAVNFVVTVKSRLEEAYRVYWRGKVVPKNITFANTMLKKSVYASRQSKLIRTHSIQDLNVTAEVHYLTETTTTEMTTVTDDLPICVREVLSEGPGLIFRIFRMEINTNTGILLGSYDITDKYDEFLMMLGIKGVHLIYKIPGRSWEYDKIFAFLVGERMVLNLLSTQAKDKTESRTDQYGRREAIVHTKEESEKSGSSEEDEAPRPPESPNERDGGHSGSVISVMRDTVEEVKEYLHNLYADDSSVDESKDESSLVHSVFSGRNSLRQLAPAFRSPKSFVKDSKRSYYLRILSKSHRLTGRAFRTMVLVFHKDYRHQWTQVAATSPNRASTPPMFRSREGSLAGVKSRSNSVQMNLSGKHRGSTRYTGSRSSSFFQPSLLSAGHGLLDGLDPKTVADIKQVSEAPDVFFKHRTLEESLAAIVLIFRCHDAFSKTIYNIKVIGKGLAPIARKIFNYEDISTKFRRERLAQALLSYLVLRFEPKDLDEIFAEQEKANSDDNRSQASSINFMNIDKAKNTILNACFGVHMMLPAADDRGDEYRGLEQHVEAEHMEGVSAKESSKLRSPRSSKILRMQSTDSTADDAPRVQRVRRASNQSTVSFADNTDPPAAYGNSPGGGNGNQDDDDGYEEPEDADAPEQEDSEGDDSI